MRTLIFLALLCSTAYSQIELSYRPAKVSTNFVSPRIVDGRVIGEVGSQPVTYNAAIVTVKSSEPCRVFAKVSLEEEREVLTITDGKEYLLTGDGRYRFEAHSYNYSQWLAVVVGEGNLPPTPPTPPKPPTPSPNPPLPSPIANDYHVGLFVYQGKPIDQAMAVKIAGWYREGAAKLYGQGGLADIDSILATINTNFANRVCTDKTICEQWDAWKKKLNAALIAEQVARKHFTREDWHSVFTEIAKALEAPK